ncbi:MAG: LysR family transcriptional regulator [Bauldia litoralis]
MKDFTDWDTLRLFLAVARAGGLGPAARQTAISAPTLGRRMAALERALELRLFDRARTGYSLTESGRALYGQAEEMETVALGIDRWRREDAPRRSVRVSAGAWTSRFLARHVGRLWSAGEPLVVEFVTATQRVDILRREADIGIRNHAPAEARLAARRLSDVAFATYRARDAADPAALPWIAVIGDAGITPSARWTGDRHRAEVALATTDPRMVLDLVAAGAGRGVLPCFVGDAETGLVRDGEAIPDLRSQQWLVLNEQARHAGAVRQVIDRIVALLAEHRALFEGEKPAG